MWVNTVGKMSQACLLYENGHIYAWRYTVQSRNECLRLIGIQAASPRSYVTHLDAAKLQQMIRDMEWAVDCPEASDREAA